MMSRPCWNAWALAFLSAAVCALSAAQAPADKPPSADAIVTVADYGAAVWFDEGPAIGTPPRKTFECATAAPGACPPLVVQIKGNHGRDNAALYIPEAGCTLVMHSVAARLQIVIRSDRNQFFKFEISADAPGDWIDIYHAENAGGRPVQVEYSNPGGALAIGVTVRGAGRIASTSAGIDVSVADGFFEYARGQADTKVESLSATGDNVLAVSSSGVGARRRDAGIAAQMATNRAAIVQRSLLGSFARVAEETAEGDLQPPTRGSPVAPSTALVFTRITDLVPRGVGFSSLALAASSASSSVVAAPSTAESFLTSGNAALAVVGARLQNTRVVANPAQGGALSISSQLGRRFTLNGTAAR